MWSDFWLTSSFDVFNSVPMSEVVVLGWRKLASGEVWEGGGPPATIWAQVCVFLNPDVADVSPDMLACFSIMFLMIVTFSLV